MRRGSKNKICTQHQFALKFAIDILEEPKCAFEIALIAPPSELVAWLAAGPKLQQVNKY